GSDNSVECGFELSPLSLQARAGERIQRRIGRTWGVYLTDGVPKRPRGLASQRYKSRSRCSDPLHDDPVVRVTMAWYAGRNWVTRMESPGTGVRSDHVCGTRVELIKVREARKDRAVVVTYANREMIFK